MLLLSTFLVIVVMVVYRLRRWQARPPLALEVRSILLAVILVLELGVIAWVETMDETRLEEDVPVLLAIATDLSLSMGAIPDPRAVGDVGTRLERAQDILLPIVNALDASGGRVMISVTGFTATSEMILGWDDNLAQIREVLEYVIAPGILTEPGSDLGIALQGVLPIFDNLPTQFMQEDAKKFLIVVSDGEQTLERGDMATALADLREKGVKTIALHVGGEQNPEGLPVYDGSNNFLGFQDIGGQIYTVPNATTMKVIAGVDPEQGLYISEQTSNPIREISDFVGVQISSGTVSSPMYTGSVLLLLALCLTALLWFV